METKFTSGPWQHYADLPSVEPNWHIITNASRMRVLANVHIEPGNAVDEANARLMVASPELFEAAADAEDAIASLIVRLADCEPGVSAQDAYDSFYTGNLADALEALRAALSKARGDLPSNKPTKSE